MGKGDKRRPVRRKPTRHGNNHRHAPDPRIDKAQAAWAERRFDDAIRLYERALESQPTNAVLLVDVARAYALRFRHDDAERLVERARRLHPDDSSLQRMLGRSFIQLQQFDRAIECFQRSLVLEPGSPQTAQTLYELARMHERLHQLDQARDYAQQAIALAPHQPVLHYLLATIDRRAGNRESAREGFERLTQTSDVPPDVVADAWYQLASIYDGHQQFDAAFAAASQAKRILNNFAGPMKYDAADITAAAQLTYRKITGDHFARWQKDSANFSPLQGRLALLTSHPRSGTTLLEQVLDSHPDLTSADELQAMSEVVFVPLCDGSPSGSSIPEILDGKTTFEIDRCRQAYWVAMQGSVRAAIAGRTLLDKNPALTGLLPVIGRVFPQMKIIFALRDPRDVVISCYMQQLPLNPVSVHYLSLEETAREYASTMRTWLKLRDILRNPWMEVRYEDTVADIAGQARRALEFLDLPWDDAVLSYRQRAAQKHVHSPTYEAVVKPVYNTSIGRWRNYSAQLDPCLDTLKPFIAAFGYEAS